MTLKQYIDFVVQKKKKNKATDQELLNCMWIEKHYPERENMPNIKITAEVDGKQVPLENISTETFEAIKTLEKPKEIPVARVGNYSGSPRLFLKITDSIKQHAAKHDLIAIKLTDGYVSNHWQGNQDISSFYDDIKPL